MKLYELPRDQGVEIHGLEVGIGDKPAKPEIIIFGHLDGAYSYCWIKGDPEAVVHLNASTELEKIEDNKYKVKR